MSNINNEVLEGNKLIAEFMGRNKAFDPRDKIYQYDSSWDWLIPAVNKFINETVPPTESRDINEYRDYCNRLHNLVTDYKIMPVFNCLTKTIKWYNQHKQS